MTASTLVSQVTTNTVYGESPQYGNPTKITASDSTGFTQESNFVYSNDATNWILGRVTASAKTKTGPGTASLTRVSSFGYNAANGFLTSEAIEPCPRPTFPGTTVPTTCDAKLTLNTTYGYDVFGNRTSVTTSGGVSGDASYVPPRTSTTTYDANGRFPTSSTNALGQSELYTFDQRFGGKTALSGPNSLTTNWAYDGFGRLTQETRADGTTMSNNYLYYTDTWPIAKYYVVTNRTGQPTSSVYFDALNRDVRSYVAHFSLPNVYAGSGKDYDAFGRVAFVYRNYLTTQTTTFLGTSFTYDPLGRVTSSLAPNGVTTTSSYSGFTTTVTVAGRTTSKTVNSQGWTMSTVDANNKTTSFAYDPNGNLLTTTDPKLNKVTMTYDLKGRKTSMTDPDMGLWQYTYDALGQLKTQSDPVQRATAGWAVTSMI